MEQENSQVLINARFLTQTTTGVQRYAIEVVKALDELVGSGHPATRGYSFTLLSPRETRHELGLKNIPIKRVGRLGGHLWEQLELPLHARRGLLVSLCNAAPLGKRNQVVTVHDAAVFANPGNFSFLFRAWYKALLKGLSRVARRIVTVSSFSEDELVRRCGTARAKLSVTHEGKEHATAVAADETILRKNGLDQRPFVLAVSSMSPNKNFGTVVRAIELLGDTDFEVVIVGGTNPKIFGGGGVPLPDSVRCVGYVQDAELRALYEGASCFVYPSFYEGFGLPPLEAMSLGCPTVASSTASMPEVCGDAVLYCDPRDPADLALKIRRLMSDPALRQDLRRKGLKRARHFTWERCARGMLDAIEAVSGSPRAAEAR